MSQLFEPIKIRNTEIRNRAWVSPMCQYSAVDGSPADWHLVHLGQYATRGAGLVFAEATAVVPEGRISPADTGLWNDEQVTAWQRITRFLREHGATPAVQLAHAGRKASTAALGRRAHRAPVRRRVGDGQLHEQRVRRARRSPRADR